MEKSKQDSEKSKAEPAQSTQQHALAILALIGGMEAHVYSCDLSQNADRPMKREQHVLLSGNGVQEIPSGNGKS